MRKVTKSKSVFPTDDSLMKMLYLAMMDATRIGRRAAEIGGKSICSWKYGVKTFIKTQKN